MIWLQAIKIPPDGGFFEPGSQAKLAKAVTYRFRFVVVEDLYAYEQVHSLDRVEID